MVFWRFFSARPAVAVAVAARAAGVTFKAVLVRRQIRETVDLSGGNSALDVFQAIFPAWRCPRNM